MASKNRVREHRERIGMTLERLAELAESSPQQISRLELGERRLTDGWMERLSVALGVRKADLLIETRGPSEIPSDPYVTKDDTERRLLLFWRNLSDETQDVILDFLDSFANRAARRASRKR
jgi:transcriptional regulator with XRE-family HTH domain